VIRRLWGWILSLGISQVTRRRKGYNRSITLKIPFKLLKDGTAYYQPRPGEPWQKVSDPALLKLVYAYYKLKVAEMVAHKAR
jgi:hypothetical protein